MKHIVQPAGNAKTAIAELQGLKRAVIAGLKKTLITGITLATTTPVSILSVAHGVVTGDRVFIGGVIVGTVALMGTVHQITRTDNDNFTLNGTNSSLYTAWGSGGTIHKCVDVVGLKADHDIFSIIAYDGDGTAAVSVIDVTALAGITPAVIPITAITLVTATPVKITSASHGLVTGDWVGIDGVVGGTVELIGKSYSVTKVDANNFTLNGTYSDNFTAWTSGGSIQTKRGRLYVEEELAAYRLVADFFAAPAV